MTSKPGLSDTTRAKLKTVRRYGAEKSDHWHGLLLRMGGGLPRHCRAAKRTQKFTPPHVSNPRLGNDERDYSTLEGAGRCLNLCRFSAAGRRRVCKGRLAGGRNPAQERAAPRLFDHLVGAGEHSRRNCEPKCTRL